MKEIKNINLHNFGNAAHILFVRTAVGRAEACEALKTKATEELKALKKALEKEDELFVQSQKDLTTDDMKEADKRRDVLYRALKKAVEAAVDFPVKASSDAGIRLRQLLKDHEIDPKMQLDKETSLLMNLTADLKGKFADDVALLGLTPLVVELAQSNDLFYKLAEARIDNQALVVLGQMKVLRAASDEAYRVLVRKVNALAVIEGEAAYADFIDKMNAEIKHYKEQAMSRPSKPAGEKKPGDKKKPDDDEKAVEKLLPEFEKAEGFAPGALKLTGKTAKGEGNAKLYELVSLSGDSIWVKVEGGKLVKVEKAN
ncbi:MAG: DUF6261 family protein [Hoylesella enoeca]|uniref:DUF6261 family protein n=1 Tax=Hoylesella enoeca TaxID=76123 RepID=UPI003F9F560A